MDVFLLCLSCAALFGMAGFEAATPGLEVRIMRGWRRGAAWLEQTAPAVWLERHGNWQMACSVLERRWKVSSPSGILMGAFLASVPAGILLSHSLLGAALLPAGLFCAVEAAASAERRKERADLEAEVPEVFRTLAVALESGKTLHQAIDYVGATHHGPVGQGFSRASLSMQAGEPVLEALSGLGREVRGPGMELMVSALEIAQRTGSPLKDLFASSADCVERQGKLRRELSVKTAQVRLSVQVVCSLPAALVALLAFISPDFRMGLATQTGISSLAGAVLLDALAIFSIRRLAKGVM